MKPFHKHTEAELTRLWAYQALAENRAYRRMWGGQPSPNEMRAETSRADKRQKDLLRREIGRRLSDKQRAQADALMHRFLTAQPQTSVALAEAAGVSVQIAIAALKRLHKAGRAVRQDHYKGMRWLEA